jgi:hypothetical protein
VERDALQRNAPAPARYGGTDKAPASSLH